MKLSIIIPTYNIKDYIDECLGSLLPQLTDECELIIVDDCSTDGTKEKIFGYLTQEMVSKYFQYKDGEKNFKFYMHEINKGVSAARNTGLKVATGEYIAFIDGDDYVKPEYIKEILEALKKNKKYYKLSWLGIGEMHNTTYLAKHLPDWNKSVWCRVFKKDIIKKLFNEKKRDAEDADFLTDNIDDRYSVGYIDIPIYVYRSGRPGSLCNPIKKD